MKFLLDFMCNKNNMLDRIEILPENTQTSIKNFSSNNIKCYKRNFKMA